MPEKVLEEQKRRFDQHGDPLWLFPLLPRVLPVGWKVAQDTDDGARYLFTARKGKKRVTLMSVVVSGCIEDDGRKWIHLSVAGPGRVPHWSELVDVKELFLGRDSKAIQVIPPRAEYVNIHPHVLHLFVCVDEDVLPDFTSGTGSL